MHLYFVDKQRSFLKKKIQKQNQTEQKQLQQSGLLLFIKCLSGSYLKQDIMKCEDKLKWKVYMRLEKWSVGKFLAAQAWGFLFKYSEPT